MKHRSRSFLRLRFMVPTFMAVAVLLLVVLWPGIVGRTVGAVVPAQARAGRQVYAYYFGWHTGESWGDGRLIDQPLARYDSRESWAINHHIEQAQSAGIDAFVVSWFGRKDNNITYPAFETLLDATAQHGFMAAAAVDMGQDNFNATVDELMDSLTYLITAKVNHPGYLRFEGKPVIYFWNQDHFSADQWRDIRKAIDPKHTTIWVMEGTNTSLLAFFDGLYLFNTAWSNNPAGTAAGWASRTYGAGGRFFTPTVMPGWDESRLGGRNNPTPPQDRAGGAFLYKSWAGAVEAGTPAILIVSWNEYLENSYIEPSARYGTQSLDVLRPLIAAWKSGRGLPQLKFNQPADTAASANPPAASNNAAPAQANEWQGRTVTSAVGSLYVRSGPGTNYARLGSIETGEMYPVQDKANGWFQIDFKGQKGFVLATMVKLQ